MLPESDKLPIGNPQAVETLFNGTPNHIDTN